MERAEAVKESHTATHAAVGRVVIDTLKGMKASPLRTQLDSFVAAADGVSRTATASAIGESISNNRWHGAMQHAVCPGPGALPLLVERRSAMRVDKDAALRLLKLIKDSTQRCAFGTRILALRDGSTRTIANVDRRKTIKQITVEFLTEILAELDEEVALRRRLGTCLRRNWRRFEGLDDVAVCAGEELSQQQHAQQPWHLSHGCE